MNKKQFLSLTSQIKEIDDKATIHFPYNKSCPLSIAVLRLALGDLEFVDEKATIAKTTVSHSDGRIETVLLEKIDGTWVFVGAVVELKTEEAA